MSIHSQEMTNNRHELEKRLFHVLMLSCIAAVVALTIVKGDEAFSFIAPTLELITFLT